MRVEGRSAFSLVEVLLAMIVLTVGILALAGSAALTSRMIGRAAQATRVGGAAAARLEWLRQVAWSTEPACTAAEWRSDSTGGSGLSEGWELLDATGPVRRVRLVLRSRRPGGISTDTVVTAVFCGSP